MARLNRTSSGLILCAVFLLASFSGAEARMLNERVPFISQAPTGRWDDRMYQDGCEEASMIMAVAWVRGTPLSKEHAVKEIRAVTAHEEKRFGRYVADTSTADTAALLKDYFRLKDVSVRYAIRASDIITELRKGRIVLVPVNGRLLANPYYKRPGPLLHMLVIRGYDDRAGMFVTNDPGTKRGAGYRYKKSALLNAIRDYPTGNHADVRSNAKAMIVVGRNANER